MVLSTLSTDISLRNKCISHILEYIYSVSTVVFVMYRFFFVDKSSLSTHSFVAYVSCSILGGVWMRKNLQLIMNRGFSVLSYFLEWTFLLLYFNMKLRIRKESIKFSSQGRGFTLTY